MSIRSIRAVISIGMLAIASDVVAQAPQEIRLWPGSAPGSERWTVPEGYDNLTHGRPDDHQRQRSDGDGLPSSSGQRNRNRCQTNDRLLEWLIARKLR